MTAPDSSVSPGIGGFIAFFLLGCALWLLMRNMVTRLRNVERRAALEDERGDEAGTTQEVQEAMSTRPASAGARVPDAPDAHEDPPAGAESRDAPA